MFGRGILSSFLILIDQRRFTDEKVGQRVQRSMEGDDFRRFGRRIRALRRLAADHWRHWRDWLSRGLRHAVWAAVNDALETGKVFQARKYLGRQAGRRTGHADQTGEMRVDVAAIAFDAIVDDGIAADSAWK